MDRELNPPSSGLVGGPSGDLTPAPVLLEVSDLWREYPSGDGTVAVLRGVNLRIHEGEMVAIIGASGSGKSTLMNILGCLDRPTRGTYKVDGQATSNLLPDELARLRREHFGFIFQRYHLLGDLNAVGNTEIPAIYAGLKKVDRRAKAAALLGRLGLSERLSNKPGQLSGGQQQRVSIARALMNGGDVILADEPTGALDSSSGEEVMRILKELHADGHTVIIVTHDAKVAAHAQRIIEVADGEMFRPLLLVFDQFEELLTLPVAIPGLDSGRIGRFGSIFCASRRVFQTPICDTLFDRFLSCILGCLFGAQ